MAVPAEGGGAAPGVRSEEVTPPLAGGGVWGACATARARGPVYAAPPASATVYRAALGDSAAYVERRVLCEADIAPVGEAEGRGARLSSQMRPLEARTEV